MQYEPQTKSETREEADEAIAERAEVVDQMRNEEGGEGGDSIGGEKGGYRGDTIGHQKGCEEEAVGRPLEEPTDQCRWFGTGMKDVDWEAGYQSEGNSDDESGGGRSEYKGTGFEYDECHRKREGQDFSEKFRPSGATLKSLPRFDETKLGRFSVDSMGELALMFFNIMFPMVVMQLLVDKVRNIWAVV